MITLPKSVKTPSGAYGSYFRIGRKRGLKVLRGSFRSMAAAYNSPEFDLAKEEAELLKLAEDSGVVPECFGVRVVKRGTVFRVGILMQHLGNKTLADLNQDEMYEADIHDQLKDALDHCGINHGDLHTRNIMFFKGKFYAIDFSPEAIQIPSSN